MDLWYDCRGALGKTTKHPQEVMKDLGITYERCKPFPLGDGWTFYNCTIDNIKLPSYIRAS